MGKLQHDTRSMRNEEVLTAQQAQSKDLRLAMLQYQDYSLHTAKAGYVRAVGGDILS
jgi:hypothetical protein